MKRQNLLSRSNDSFAPIPKAWTNKPQLHQLILSRLYAGAVWEEKEVETPSGVTFVLQKGEVWFSIDGLVRDLDTIGIEVARHKVKYALTKLTGEHFKSRRLANPSSRGRYGVIVELYPMIEEANHDPLEARRAILPKNGSFLLGQSMFVNQSGSFCMGEKNNADVWTQYIAKNGSDSTLFTTIGRWNAMHLVRVHSSPVYVPYFIIDIDRHDDLIRAYDDTRLIVDDIISAGFCESRTLVSFSGSKGFNIAISADQVGDPVFRTSDVAREIIGDLLMSTTETEIDPHTFSPLNMIRLTGSRHNKTGLYKRTWSAEEFERLSFPKIWDTRNSFTPYAFPDAGSPCEEPAALIKDIASSYVKKTVSRLSGRQYKYTKIPKPVQNILDGISEGQKYSPYRSGRDWAAYTLACHLLSTEEMLEKIATYLQISSSNPFSVFEYWNDERCNPPLTKAHLKAKFRSAEKTIEKQNAKSKI